MSATIPDEWFEEHFGYYNKLLHDSKFVFLDFLFLWTFFEYRSLDRRGKISDIRMLL